MSKGRLGTIMATGAVAYALINFAAPESGEVVKQRATDTADNLGQMASVGGQNVIWTGSDWLAAGRQGLAENSDLLTGGQAPTETTGGYPKHP